MKDITAAVEKCASSLSYHKPFLRNKSFSLVDSMAALELMDPKMDCCETKETSLNPMTHSRKSVTSTYLWNNLTMMEVYEIALESLIRFEAYLDAANVAESIYTCLYMHDSALKDMKESLEIEKIDEKENHLPQLCLYAISLSIVKLTEKIRVIVQSADIYEEEDFSPNSYSFLFCPGIAEEDVFSLLDSILKTLKNDSNEESSSLSYIFQFIKNMFMSCSLLSNMTSENVRLVANNVIHLSEDGCTQLDELLQRKNENQSSSIIHIVFDQLANRHLLGNAPVRKINFKNPWIAIENLRKIMNQFQTDTCELLLHANSLNETRWILMRNSISSSNILIRSLNVLNLYFNDLIFGQHSLSDLIAQSIHQLNGVPKEITSHEISISFFKRIGKPIYDSLKLLLLNRNRQRQYIDAIIIKEWGNIQTEANKLDLFFNQQQQQQQQQPSLFITNYVLNHTIWIMEHYISLSIDLKLWNGANDYSIVFWYLDFLLSTQMSIWTTMRNTKMEQLVKETLILKSKNPTKSKKKGKSGKKSKPITTSKPLLSKMDKHLSMEFLLLTIRRNICRGTVRFIAALNQANMISKNKYRFTNESYRFMKRFEILGNISQPPLLTYDDYLQGSDFTNVSPEDLISSASDCFKTAKLSIDQVLDELDKQVQTSTPIQKDEIIQLAKVCIGNSLFLHKLKQMISDDNQKKNKKVSFDFISHSQFCSIYVE